MYTFQSGMGKRKSKKTVRLLLAVIFILIIALCAVTFVYLRSNGFSDTTSEALMARAISEAGSAQAAVYRMTQTSGTNTMTLLSTARGHIYAMQCLNTLTSNIYGPGTVLADPNLIASSLSIISECEAKLQAGGVLTGLHTSLRDNVDQLVASFGPAM